MVVMFQERAIDRQFAAFICNQTQGKCSEVFRLVVALISSAVGKGNICLNLEDIAGQTVSVDGKDIVLPELDDVLEMLRTMPTVGLPGEHKPLVVDRCGRLYLYRYWRYEQKLAGIILQKASAIVEGIDETVLQAGLARLFSKCDDEKSDGQKQAASVALHKQFCVISGGPGTGKTSTVVRILALLLEQEGGRKLRIAMATPTGKAAVRLKTSVNDIRRSLDCSEEVRLAIPDEVVTIQRLLGSLSGSSRFRHSARNPLSFDVIIIDEASMVALPLMTALVEAMKPNARLILLGDKDQLASVEAGAVLGDICNAGEGSDGSRLTASVVKLEKNYRFQAGSGIAEISQAVNDGLDSVALEILKSNTRKGIGWNKLPESDELRRMLAPKVVEGYQGYLDADSASEALERFDRFRILCALREGPYGVSGLNTVTERILGKAGLILPDSSRYRGRPILITVNDYSIRLFNGDTGILFPDPESGGAIKAFFPDQGGGYRSIPVERLPIHETAFAMTIHKSQGSEFDQILMLLPPEDSNLITRELIYTGITRGKTFVEIWANEEAFCVGVRKMTERHSGLRDALEINS